MSIQICLYIYAYIKHRVVYSFGQQQLISLSIVEINSMRLFITLKQNNRSLQTRRIQLQPKQLTTQYFIAQLRRIMKIQKNTDIIIRLIPKKHNAQHKTMSNSSGLKLRILEGWKLQDYKLQSGMQIQIQILSDHCQQLMYASNAKQSNSSNNSTTASTNVQTNVVVFKKQFQQIEQQENNDADDNNTSDICKLILQKYQQLLKLIQKGNFGRFMKQLKYLHPKLDTCQNQYYHQELLAIMKELGEKGWAAIHYAVYSGCIEAIQYLIQIGVDINMKTLDDWTPLQLALNQQSVKVVQILISQPLIDVNISSSHGLPINMALNMGNLQIIKLLLKQDLDLSSNDYKGISPQDLIKDQDNPQIIKLFKDAQNRFSVTHCRSETFHTLIYMYRGEVTEVKTPPRRDKQIYLVLNPYDKTVELFESKQKYPETPRQIIPITQSINFSILSKKEMSWYMKQELTVFLLMNGMKKLHQFAVNFNETAKQWCKSLASCKQNIRVHMSHINTFIRNQKVILDRIQININSPTKILSKDKLMNIFTSRMQSDPKSSMQKDEKETSNGSTHTVKKSNEQQKQVLSCTPVKQTPISQTSDKLSDSKNKGIKFSDFQIIRTLGQGAFGTVFLAHDLRVTEKQKYYALKCFKKKKLIMNKQIKYTIAQLTILKQLCHPFIVNLHFTFQTPNYVYLGLDYCSGKDLAHHLVEQVTFSESDCRIYAAQILSALEYLHSKNIIYRDLKPENIMIDENGHVKLVDFGLSKQGSDANFTAKSFCGSPAYISPQMLLKGGVTKQSDYYCLGAVLYEMIIGQPPFFSDDIQTLYSNISNGKLSFPKHISSDAKSLLTKLLQRNPSKRLGKSGIHEIKKHDFFKKIDWDKLGKKLQKGPKREYDHQDDIMQQQLIKIIHKDFDYMGDNYRINRFVNFSFERQAVEKQ